MFLLWYRFPWTSCYDRYSFYCCGFVTCISIPLYRESSFGFGIWYSLLTFCGCGMVIFVHFNLLLGILTLLIFLTIRLGINTHSFNAYNINQYLEDSFNKFLTNKHFISLKNKVNNILPLIFFMCRSYEAVILVIALITFIEFLSFYIAWPFILIFLLYDFYYYKKYNISLLIVLKNWKNYIAIFITLYLVCLNLYSNFYNIDISNIDIFILIIIMLMLLTLLYINIINKSIRKNYPFLLFVFNCIGSVLILILGGYILWTSRGPSAGPGGGPSGGPSGGPGGGPSGGPGGGPSGGPGVDSWWTGNTRHHESEENPTKLSTYPDWVLRDPDPEKVNNITIRPLTPDPGMPPITQGPQAPGRPPRPVSPRTLDEQREWIRANAFPTKAPNKNYRRHWEDETIYLDSKPANGDTYRWINSRFSWVPARYGVWVNRDFIYNSAGNRWYWQVGKIEGDTLKRYIR